MYCTPACQKSAWKSGHKNECKAYKIELHPDYGRYLVATRDLKPGSRILSKLQPSVVGPPLLNPNYACLEAYKKDFSTDPEMSQYLVKLESKPNLRLISPLKFLCLEKSAKSTFENLIKLESNMDQIGACFLENLF